MAAAHVLSIPLLRAKCLFGGGFRSRSADSAYSDLTPPSEVGKTPVPDMVDELSWKQPRQPLRSRLQRLGRQGLGAGSADVQESWRQQETCEVLMQIQPRKLQQVGKN